MKTLIQLTIISLILMTSFSNASAQHHKREVVYSTYTTTTYAIPEKTDIYSFSDLELIQMNKEPAKEKCEILVNDNNMVTTINTYLDMPRFYNDFTHEVGMRITDEHGMTLLDHQGNILRHPTDTDNVNNLPLSDREIEHLGIYNAIFEQNPRDMFNRFLQDGFRAQYDSRRNIVKAEMQNVLTIVDFRNHIIEIIFYDNRVVNNAVSTFYKKINGYFIPTTRIRTDYEDINGIRVERVENCIYSTYSVTDENGKTLVNFSQNSENITEKGLIMQEYIESGTEFLVTAYPNPVENQITVNIMDGDEESATVTFFDLSGKKLITRRIETCNPVQIDLSELSAGSYILYCRSGKNEESQKIIKK